jgi:hypothetical protein
MASSRRLTPDEPRRRRNIRIAMLPPTVTGNPRPLAGPLQLQSRAHRLERFHIDRNRNRSRTTE